MQQLLTLAITSFNISLRVNLLESLLDIWKHCLCSLQNLQTINQIGHCLHSLLQLGALCLNESLLIYDFFLNLLEKQIKCLLFAITNDFKLVQEPLNILWSIDLDMMVLALGTQVLQQSLTVFACFDLWCVWQ